MYRRVGRWTTAALCVAAVAVPAHALAAGRIVTQADVAAHQEKVLDATVELVGHTVTFDGNDLDNVRVEARPSGSDEVAASALSYGGEFELWLVPGAYDLTYSRKGFAGVTRHVSVLGLLDLEPVTMLHNAPTLVDGLSIGDTARVGSVLHGEPGTWSRQDVEFTYQWLLDGQKITGAHAGSLRVLPAYFRHDLSLKVTTVREGYVDGTATSDALRVSAAKPTLDADRPTWSRGRWHVAFGLDLPAWATPDGTVEVCGPKRCWTAPFEGGDAVVNLPAPRRTTSYTGSFDGPKGVRAADLEFRLRRH